MGQRPIDAGDGSKTNRRRRWVKDKSTQEMVRSGFFETKRKGAGDGTFTCLLNKANK